MKLRRIDSELVRRGLAKSRAAAAQMIEDGRVKLDGQIVLKPARQMDPAQAILVEESGDPEYVSRGAHKLAGALDALGDRASGSGRRCFDGWFYRRVAAPRRCIRHRRRRRVRPARVEAAERPARGGARSDERAHPRSGFRCSRPRTGRGGYVVHFFDACSSGSRRRGRTPRRFPPDGQAPVRNR